jgi:hypothetical protein
MVFGFGQNLFKKKSARFVVATVLVAVEGGAFRPLIDVVKHRTDDIVRGRDDFTKASRAVADVARALLDHESEIAAAASGGDVFSDETDASAHVADVFADLSSRYRASAEDDSTRADVGTGTSDERRAVVMLTVAYRGENDDVERELHDRMDLARILTGIVALHEGGALLAAHVHVAPAHEDDRMTDERMLALFPELLPI